MNDNATANTPSESVDITEDYKSFKNVFNDPKADLSAFEAKEADIGEDTPATEEVTDAGHDDEPDDLDTPNEESEVSDASEEDEVKEPENKGKKGKPSAQERINEITRQKYEAERARIEVERRAFELEQRLATLEKAASTPNKVEHNTTNTRTDLPPGAPNPDATLEDGSAVYPLGEYDPKYIFDLTSFASEQKAQEIENRRQAQLQQEQLAREQQAVADNYRQKFDAYEAEVPEIRERVANLMTAFASLEPQYGEYLATSIMQCDNGPAIMDYLSQNIGEAQEIVASGPAAATRKIGRLDAMLERSQPEEKRNEKVISESIDKAPPPTPTRGSSKGRPPVRPDTTDYAAFKRDFLKGL